MSRLKEIAGVTTLSLVAAFGTAGCSTISFSASDRPLQVQRGTAEENTSLFKGQDSFEERIRQAGLQNGMAPEETFRALGLDVHNFKALTGKELMDAAYAGATPTPQTEAAMREIMSLVNRTEVYRLNYKNVSSKTGVGINLSAQTKTNGFDRQLTLIFVDGKLQNANKVLSGDPAVNTTNTSHIWDLLSGAATSGVRSAVPKP